MSAHRKDWPGVQSSHPAHSDLTSIPPTSTTSWVVDFVDGSREMRDLLGGKGANVAEMTRVVGAGRVPGGFTITTDACVAYMRGEGSFPDGLDEQVAAALDRLEAQAGKRLGDGADPLLVSVRSGARESMPGMLDTVLNLGLNDESVGGLAGTPGTPIGASCKCSATSRRGSPASASRTRSRPRNPPVVSARTPSSTSML